MKVKVFRHLVMGDDLLLNVPDADAGSIEGDL